MFPPPPNPHIAGLRHALTLVFQDWTCATFGTDSYPPIPPHPTLVDAISAVRLDCNFNFNCGVLLQLKFSPGSTAFSCPQSTQYWTERQQIIACFDIIKQATIYTNLL